MFGYNHRANDAVKLLDKHDLSEWVKLCLFFGVRDPRSIISHTRTWFDGTEIDMAIDALTVEDFMAYLEARYNVVFDREPIRYRMRER